MRPRGLLLTLLLVGAPSVAAAQHSQCVPFDNSSDHRAFNLCNGAIDAGEFFHPLLGLAISGGNPVVGSFRTFGGLGHLSVGVRATAFKTPTPDLSYDGTTSTVPQGDSIPLGAPTIDAGLGIYRGLPSGLLAIDLLGSVVAVPNDVKDLHVDPKASTMGNFAYKVGWGARVGLIRGRFPIPSVNLSLVRREVPTVQVGDVTSGDQFDYRLALKSTSTRITAGWHIAIFEIGGGLGKDHYTGNGHIDFQNPLTATTDQVDFDLDENRTTIFADLGIIAGPLKIGGEIGKQTNNSLNTVSDFQGINVKDGRTYASAGVRLAF